MGERTKAAGIQGASGTPGGRRRVTLSDVAREAGVSSGLVSMVLSGRPGPSPTTAARINEVAQRMGYRPDRAASLLARRNTGQLGVTLTPSNPYHGAVVEEILAYAHDCGYEVVLSPVSPRHDDREAVEALVNSRCEALILLNPQLSNSEVPGLVAGVPTVCFGRPLQTSHVDVVRMDDEHALELLVDHLYGLGHRAIAHVDGGEQVLAKVRTDGYLAAMARRRLKPLVLPGGETAEQGAAAVAPFTGDLPFTAVTAFNDLAAMGVMDQLSRNGFDVPRDVSVTGFDDDWLAGMSAIDLTTIDPHPLEQARQAVDLALERVRGERTRKVTRVIESTIVVRGSTGVPAKSRR